MPASPSPDNLILSKGILKFKKTGSNEYRDLGDAAEVQTTPAIERKDHFTQRFGIKVKNKSVVAQKMLSLRAVLEEWTDENLAIYFMSDDPVAVSGETYTRVDMLGTSEITGALRFIGQNDVGVRCQYDWPFVNLSPGGAADLLSDEWGRLEINGEVTVTPSGRFGTILVGIDEEVTDGLST